MTGPLVETKSNSKSVFPNVDLRDIKEITQRKTSLLELLSPDEQQVFDRFKDSMEMLQKQVNKEGVPQYFVYKYGRGNAVEGVFHQISPDQTEPGRTRFPMIIPVESTVVGPIFCVYPQKVSETVTIDAQGIPHVGTIRVGDNFLLDDYREPASYEDKYFTVKNGPRTVLERGCVAAFLDRLLAVKGDEEIRTFLVTCKGDDFSIVMPHVATSSKLLKLKSRDTSGELIGLSLMHPIAGAVAQGLGLSDALKYALVSGGNLFDLTVVEGNYKTSEVSELVYYSARKSRMKPQESYEKYIEQEVFEALRIAQVPKNSVVLGSLPEFLESIDFGVQHLYGDEFQLTVTIQQFGAVLKALKKYGLDFLGSTLPYISSIDSKTTPAIVSDYASLPYPRVDIVARDTSGNVETQTLNEGIFWEELFGPVGSGVFVHQIGNSRRQGISFIPQGYIGKYVPPKQGSFVVMPLIALHDRERRVIFHPELGVLFTQDRIVTDRKSRNDDLMTRKHVERKEIRELTLDEHKEYKEYLCALDNQHIARIIGDSELGLEFVDRIKQLYEEAGIHPTLGVFGYDFLWALEGKETSSKSHMFQDGIPFVSEMHSIMSLDNETLLEAGRSFLKKLKEKYKNRNFVIPNHEVTCITQMLSVALEAELQKGAASKLDWTKFHLQTSNGKPYSALHYHRQSVKRLRENIGNVAPYTDFAKRRILRAVGL